MLPNLIGSQWRVPADGAGALPVYNPATGEVIEQVPLSGARDVDAAVQAAGHAYAAWSRTAVMPISRRSSRRSCWPFTQRCSPLLRPPDCVRARSTRPC